MLHNLNRQIRECLDHAEDCARKAAAQTAPKLKEDFLAMERRWLALAQSYDFSQRLGDFSDEAKRQADKLQCQRSASLTPFLRNQAFDPETVETMGKAFATTCKALGLSNRDDAMTKLIAEKIIELTQCGHKNPTALHLAAINEFKSDRQYPDENVASLSEQRNQSARVHSMTDVRPFPKTDMPAEEPTKALILCPNCNVEMALFGIEAESDARNLYTFECSACDVIEVRGVRLNKTPPVVIVA